MTSAIRSLALLSLSLIAFVSITACTRPGVNATAVNGARNPANQPLVKLQSECVTLKGPVRYPMLKRAIQNCGIHDLDDLLERLPADYRSYYSLVYRSRSLQRASVDFQTPRVIFYGADAKTILTVTGDPKHPDYHRMEVMEYDEAAARYDLHEIEFPSDQAMTRSNDGKKLSDTSITQGWPDYAKLVQFREREGKCLTCHGSETRAIMSSYPFWGGFYGANDDVVDGKDGQSTQYAKFRKIAQNHPRYKSLNPRAGAETSPFNDRERDDRLERYPYRPNLRLTKLLSVYAAKTLVRRLQSQPAYYAVRPFFLLGNVDCQRAYTLVGSEALRKEITRVLEPFPGEKRRFLEYLENYSSDKDERDSTPGLLGGASTYVLGAVLYALGLDPADLTLDLARSITFVDGGGSLARRIEHEIVLDAYRSDSELSGLMATRTRSGYPADVVVPELFNEIDTAALGQHCDAILARYAAQLAATAAKPLIRIAAPIVVPPSPLVRNCAGCHMGGPVVEIDFTRPEKLAPSLLRKSWERVKSKHMPLDHPIAFEDYGEREDLLLEAQLKELLKPRP